MGYACEREEKGGNLCLQTVWRWAWFLCVYKQEGDSVLYVEDAPAACASLRMCLGPGPAQAQEREWVYLGGTTQCPHTYRETYACMFFVSWSMKSPTRVLGEAGPGAPEPLAAVINKDRVPCLCLP